MLYLHEESDENTKNECLNKMKFLLIELQKMNFQYEYSSMNEIKDHILLLHQTLYDSLKKLSLLNSELNQQEVNFLILYHILIKFQKSWRKTCDKLLGDKEGEKKESIFSFYISFSSNRKKEFEILESGRKKSCLFELSTC